MNELKRLIGILLFLVCHFSVANPNDLLEQMQKKYDDENAVFLNYKREVTIDLVNDSLQVKSHQFYDMLHLSENSNIFSSDKIYSSHFVKINNINAKTLIPVRRKYKEIPVENFKEKSEITDGIFYDDSKSISFVFPAVTKGCRTVLDYDLSFTDPRFLNAFHFSSYLPIEQADLVLKVDKNIRINHKSFHVNNVDITFKKSSSNQYDVYHWQGKNLQKVSSDVSSPPLTYYAPHIIYYIDSYQQNNQKKSVLSDVDDLYRMYSTYLEGINDEKNPMVQAIVDSLTRDCDSELDKVKNIFYWVQDNIKYIAFENGMRGLIPHDGSLVLQKRYGDCKDMASLIHWMLNAANIKSYYTWIGSRDLPYKYSELPTPNVDNHMIATYENQGKNYFLDATSNYTRFGFPSSMIQGKEALLAINDSTYAIENVPIIPKEENLLYDSSGFVISDNQITGQGKLTLHGFHKIFNTYLIESFEKTDQKELITEVLTKGNNKFFLDDYSINNLSDRDLPLSIDYEFKLMDYHKSIGDEIFVNLSFDKAFFNDLIDLDQRELPIEYEFLYQNNYVTTLSLPEKFSIDYLPENTQYSHDLFGFSIRYKLKKNVLKQYKTIYINSLMVEKEHFKQWNKMVDMLNDAYREVLILKQNS